MYYNSSEDSDYYNPYMQLPTDHVLGFDKSCEQYEVLSNESEAPGDMMSQSIRIDLLALSDGYNASTSRTDIKRKWSTAGDMIDSYELSDDASWSSGDLTLNNYSYKRFKYMEYDNPVENLELSESQFTTPAINETIESLSPDPVEEVNPDEVFDASPTQYSIYFIPSIGKVKIRSDEIKLLKECKLVLKDLNANFRHQSSFQRNREPRLYTPSQTPASVRSCASDMNSIDSEFRLPIDVVQSPQARDVLLRACSISLETPSDTIGIGEDALLPLELEHPYLEPVSSVSGQPLLSLTDPTTLSLDNQIITESQFTTLAINETIESLSPETVEEVNLDDVMNTVAESQFTTPAINETIESLSPDTVEEVNPYGVSNIITESQFTTPAIDETIKSLSPDHVEEVNPDEVFGTSPTQYSTYFIPSIGSVKIRSDKIEQIKECKLVLEDLNANFHHHSLFQRNKLVEPTQALPTIVMNSESDENCTDCEFTLPVDEVHSPLTRDVVLQSCSISREAPHDTIGISEDALLPLEVENPYLEPVSSVSAQPLLPLTDPTDVPLDNQEACTDSIGLPQLDDNYEYLGGHVYLSPNKLLDARAGDLLTSNGVIGVS